MRSLFIALFLLCLAVPGTVLAKDPLAQWTPQFDPTSAPYKYVLSCVGHPAIEGVAVGYRIRDRVWQESAGWGRSMA